MISVGVNGLGRIGRSTVHQVLNSERFELHAVNDLMPRENAEYLLNHDTVHRREKTTKTREKGLKTGDTEYSYSQERNPENLDWKGLDLVFECTGQFRTREKASKLPGDRVVVSAPPKDKETDQYVYGVNHTDYSGEEVVSAASCTTNSAAPPLNALKKRFSIEAAEMATVHAYTGSQNLVDRPNSKTRRGRAAAENIVPTTTGASEAVTEILPGLKGKFDATAYRVPVPDGSITHLTVNLEENPSKTEVNDALREEASRTPALDVTTEPLVSGDVTGTDAGSIADLEKTSVRSGLTRIAAWYDNEAGYTAQMIRLGEHVVR